METSTSCENSLSKTVVDLPIVSGVTDWEYTYAAPAEFIHVAPWWLLLQSPEDWEDDLNQFLRRYTAKLRVFLEALNHCENKLIEQRRLSESQRLAPHMERSMETGLFWVCLAARYSSMFDEIYWTFIDERWYGSFTSLEDRIQRLDKTQQNEIKELVRLKMGKYSGNESSSNDNYPIDQLLEL
ncbi:Phosphotransferase enzyme family [Aspergillus sclerotialis]|uniref:Phosphotransferase enzyme family n=1 Tax=Aspergillus sclerotialis TaxID=2070753 RepID=A0A3A2ZFC2_9EURO|nr:Phosphotransferase enzyme family [Aspergillus sclerotialis]